MSAAAAGRTEQQKEYWHHLTTKMATFYMDCFPDNILFFNLQDSALCYVARICNQWFTENDIQVLGWAGNSPELNPIEHFWFFFKPPVHLKRPSNKRGLIEAIIVSWQRIIKKKRSWKIKDTRRNTHKTVTS